MRVRGEAGGRDGGGGGGGGGRDVAVVWSSAVPHPRSAAGESGFSFKEELTGRVVAFR